MEDQFSLVTSLIGDPVRSKIMWALLDGKAYTASELALYADTTPQNMSMHLAKLIAAKLLAVEKQGRHRYYNYASVDISYAIEALANLIPATKKNNTIHSGHEPIRFCRTCYDHLAGELGVKLTDSLINRILIVKEHSNFMVTSEGAAFLDTLNINTDLLKLQKRSFARACLDWSERKPHLAGSLGAALLTYMLSNDWMRRTQNSRAIIITGKGREGFYRLFDIDI